MSLNSSGTVTLILNISNMCSGLLPRLCRFKLEKLSTVPSEWEAGLAPEPLWNSWNSCPAGSLSLYSLSLKL